MPLDEAIQRHYLLKMLEDTFRPSHFLTYSGSSMETQQQVYDALMPKFRAMTTEQLMELFKQEIEEASE